MCEVKINKLNKVVSIGWYSEGVNYIDNYISVSIIENGKNDLELLCANSISKSDHIAKYISDFISDVQRLHEDFDFIFSYYISLFNSSNEFADEVKNEIIRNLPIVKIVKFDGFENKSYKEKVKSIYPWHSNLSEEEFKAAFLSIFATSSYHR